MTFLAQDESFISIKAKDPANRPVTMTESQERSVAWLVELLLPGIGSGNRHLGSGETEEVVRFRSTLVLLVVFAALGGYVYFAEYRGRDEREQQEASKKKLFPTPLKDVVGLSLAFPDHKISAVKKDDKHWEFTEPQGIDADSDEWEMLVSSLGQIEKGACRLLKFESRAIRTR